MNIWIRDHRISPEILQRTVEKNATWLHPVAIASEDHPPATNGCSKSLPFKEPSAKIKSIVVYN